MAKAAPGDLELIRQFVNTLDVEDGFDALGDPAELQTWLAERDLIAAGDALTADDLTRARGVRDALRSLLLANNGVPLDPTALEAINEASADAALLARFDRSGAAALAPARPGLDGALARLLAIAVEAMRDGSWRRLKACADHACEAAFYDWSRNRSGTWCSMSVCGNRAKARNYRNRHR
jgi:predicted RNA-binding Zn ribbon-like protein